MTRVATIQLQCGDIVITTEPTGSDFGLPLVEPTRASRGKPRRRVRAQHRAHGGHVVWFDDGTKTHPIHGRTVWLAEGHEE